MRIRNESGCAIFTVRVQIVQIIVTVAHTITVWISGARVAQSLGLLI
jgi:hypothetical protein